MASDIDDFSKEQMTKKAMLGLTPFYNNGHTSAKFTQDDEGEALDGSCFDDNAARFEAASIDRINLSKKVFINIAPSRVIGLSGLYLHRIIGLLWSIA